MTATLFLFGALASFGLLGFASIGPILALLLLGLALS